MKRVVVHHAHHEDEGVYRIIVATATQTVTQVHVPNPLFDPSAKLLADGDPSFKPETNGYMSGDMNGNGTHMNGDWTSPSPEERLMLVDATILEPVMVEERNETVLSDHVEIVFAADDERWQGRTLEDIAAEQRQIVKEHLASQEAAQLEAQAKEAASIHDMGSGDEL